MDILLLAALASAAAPQAEARPLQGGAHSTSGAQITLNDDDSNKPLVAAPIVAAPARAEQGQFLEGPGDQGGPSLSNPAKPSPSAFVDSIVGSTRLQSLLTRPMAQVEHGEAIVRGKNFKAILSEDGLRFSPVVGSRANADVHFQLSAIERGGEPLAVESGAPAIKDGALQMQRGVALERYAYSLDGVEQTFTFDSLTGTGDLVVRMNVETALAAELQGRDLVFRGDAAEVRYSEAFVLDATGNKVAIETTFDGSSIELTVPAGYLANATFPVTIDPVLNTFAFGGGVLDDTKPDVAYNVGSAEYFVVFEDFVSSTDADTYGFTLSASGVVDDASFVSLSIGSIDHRRPRVALNVNTETFMVVAAGLPSGDTNRRIYGQMVAIDAGTAAGIVASPNFEVNDSPGSFDCGDPDVAGNTFPSFTESFAVVWNRVFNATDRDIHARIVNVNETFITGRINVDNSILDDRECRISSSIGDTSVADYYNIVWIRGDGSGTDTVGDVYSRRLYFNGTFTGPFPSTRVLVDGAGNARMPATTSTVSRPLEGTGELFHVVAYEKVFGINASIFATPVTFSDVAGAPQNVSIMEDVDFAADQREVDITTDGVGIMLVYSEQFNGPDYDTYFCSGAVQNAPGGQFRVTLSERHQNMAFSIAPERFPAIASRFDGGDFGTGTSDDACAVWEENGASNRIEGATLDLENNVPGFGNIAVGSQYCQAEENSSGTKGWIRGMALNQRLSTSKTIQAFEVTTNAFGYLLVGDVSGFVPNPAGARGNLCVLGAGRYVDQIANSGPTGSLLSTVNPLNIPQPTGFTAIAPGETWFFQYWTRDISTGGTPTSNFTNGLSMTFTN